MPAKKPLNKPRQPMDLSMDACAARGAKYLDNVDPGWATMIDLSTLRMNSGQQCIIGKCYGEFWQALERAAVGPGKSDAVNHRWASNYGFNLQDRPRRQRGDTFEHLTITWAPLVASRQMAARLGL